MPLDETGTPHCINHQVVAMRKNSTLNAITRLEKKAEGKYNFKADTGIPIRVYICPICGYIETYLEK